MNNEQEMQAGLTDQDFLKGLEDDIVRAVNSYGLHVGMHEAAAAAEITGRPAGALTFNTISSCTKETFLAVLARLLDHNGGGSLNKAKSRKEIITPTDFKKEVNELLKCYDGNGLKKWRNGILSHKDGKATARAIAVAANLQIYDDYLPLLKRTFICIGDLSRENEKAFTGLRLAVGVPTDELFNYQVTDATESGKLLTHKLFDLKSA